MSAQVLLNLLKSSGKEIKCKACRAFYCFCTTSLPKFNNAGQKFIFRLSYDIKVTLKSI